MGDRPGHKPERACAGTSQTAENVGLYHAFVPFVGAANDRQDEKVCRKAEKRGDRRAGSPDQPAFSLQYSGYDQLDGDR